MSARGGLTQAIRPGRKAAASADVPVRLDALQRVLDLGGDRLDPEAAEWAAGVVRRTGQRLALGLDHTVVAFAGATGSGKSSLFNAMCGTQVSRVGARRPTTSKATGLVVGGGGDQLLDWLSVPRRHRLDVGSDGIATLEGLVLLDLPDHDSTAMAHRLEVDRLVKLVDLLVWVVDPQKYADDALHSGYLQPMAPYASVMTVVLNQVDRLDPEDVGPCVRDLSRLLAEDGLPGVPVLACSAQTGRGLDELRERIVAAVDAHEAVRRRVLLDLDDAAARLAGSVADTETAPEKVPGASGLVDALVGAAGVPMVLDAVGADYRRAARARTGWPFTRWLGRLRRSPLDRLRLGRGASSGRAEVETGSVARSSLPTPGAGQQAQVALTTRQIASQCATGLPMRWQDAVRDAAVPPGPDLADALDRAVTRTPLTFRNPVWWWLVGVLQVLLAVSAVAGAVWLGGLALIDYLGWPEPGTPMIWLVQPERLGVPLPSAMLIGGIVLGLLLSVLASALAGVGARRRRRKAAKALRAEVAAVGTTLVLDPVAVVLAEHRDTRNALQVARTGRS
ncbi:MAG: GTPase family protein [Actinomycetales bacterium]